MGQGVTSTQTAHPAPAEGLPPCVSLVVFEGRRAWMVDADVCGHPHIEHRFVIVADTLICWDTTWAYHPGILTPQGTLEGPLFVRTDDPAEAQAAFERGAEWVRTGMMA